MMSFLEGDSLLKDIEKSLHDDDQEDEDDDRPRIDSESPPLPNRELQSLKPTTGYLRNKNPASRLVQPMPQRPASHSALRT